VIGACNRRGARLSGQVLAQAAGVIVHDVWGAQQIRQRSPQLADLTAVVPHGAEIQQLPYERRAEIRHRFGFSDDALLFGCFGILHRSKCNIEAILAFAAVASRHPKAILFFVGQDLGEGEAQEKSASLGLQDRVRFLGHAPISTFRELAAAADVGINLRRPPTNGETSGALLTLLSGVLERGPDARYPASNARIG
jgi:glycosyltransferase involved in cell wall biosynthesis